MSPVVRAALRGVVACTLLLVGFGGVVAVLFRLQLETGGADAEIRGRSLLVATTYFRVVFFKGLLPQLVLALALWPIAERLLRPADRGRRAWGAGLGRRLPSLAVASVVAWLVVAPLLLVVDLPGWPAFHMRTVSHCLGTAATSVLAVVAAAGAAHLLVCGRPDRASGAATQPPRTDPVA